MTEDAAPRRTRRSRAELKELMLEGGAEVLAQAGIQLQIASVSYAKVFEHLEETREVRITYGSVHERIWDSLQEYQVEVIRRAGLWDASTDDTEAWIDWLRTMVAMKSQSDDAPAHQAATTGATAAYAGRDAAAAQGGQASNGDDQTSATIARLSVAISEGLALRRSLTNEAEPTVQLPTGPDGSHEEWSLHDLAMRGVRQALEQPRRAPE